MNHWRQRRVEEGRRLRATIRDQRDEIDRLKSENEKIARDLDHWKAEIDMLRATTCERERCGKCPGCALNLEEAQAASIRRSEQETASR